jgi:hypothetical protein
VSDVLLQVLSLPSIATNQKAGSSNLCGRTIPLISPFGISSQTAFDM